MNDKQYDTWTRVVQSLLQAGLPNSVVTLSDGSKHVLSVDGKFGAFSAAAYLQAAPGTRAAVDNYLRLQGTSEVDLQSYRLAQKRVVAALPKAVAANGLKRYYDWPSIQASIDRACQVLDADPDVRTILMQKTFVNIEAKKAAGMNGLYDSWFIGKTSPFAMGIFQFIPSTWNKLAANKSLSLLAVDTSSGSPIVPVVGGPLDMNANVRALVQLTDEDAKILRSQTPPLAVTVDSLYFLHQQGDVRRLTGEISAVGLANQSGPSLVLVSNAAKAVGNTALAANAMQIALAKGAVSSDFA